MDLDYHCGISEALARWIGHGRLEDLQPLQHRAEQLPRAGAERSVPREAGKTSLLQVSTWGCQPRCRQPATRPSGNPTTRPVEDGHKCEKVPKGKSTESAVWIPSKRGPNKSSRRRRRTSRATAEPALTARIAFSITLPVFVEIFCGKGLLGRTVARLNNWATLLWDITLGPECDLKRLCNRAKIIGWMRAGLVRGLHLGTPCNTFSRARDHGPGPPPLRSDSFVLGLPGLRPCDEAKVAEGNLLMRFSASILGWARRLCLPCTLENPRGSRLWMCPSMQYVLRWQVSSIVHFEMCMLGTPWRKPTSILGVHVNLEPLGRFRCLGAKRGCCLRTGEPHV